MEAFKNMSSYASRYSRNRYSKKARKQSVKVERRYCMMVANTAARVCASKGDSDCKKIIKHVATTCFMTGGRAAISKRRNR